MNQHYHHHSCIIYQLISDTNFTKIWYLCWRRNHNSWDMIACTFENKFKNALLLPTSSQPSFALYSSALLLWPRQLGWELIGNSSTFLSFLSKQSTHADRKWIYWEIKSIWGSSRNSNSSWGIWGITFAIPWGMRNMRNQTFNSPGNEEAKLAKIPEDGDPRGPHWELYCQQDLFKWF